jgi:hypothetical protein
MHGSTAKQRSVPALLNRILFIALCLFAAWWCFGVLRLHLHLMYYVMPEQLMKIGAARLETVAPVDGRTCPVHHVRMTQVLHVPVPKDGRSLDQVMSPTLEEMGADPGILFGIYHDSMLEPAMRARFPFAAASPEELRGVPLNLRILVSAKRGARYDLWQCPPCRQAARTWERDVGVGFDE